MMQAARQEQATRITGNWLLCPETRALMTALEHDGAKARFVGGCVRDAMLGRTVHDIDIAIDEIPEKTVGLIEKAGFRAIPTGIDHGTVTAVVNHKSFEVTSLREDTATDGRHATVRYTTDWQRDASRRDFTMNALYADSDGTVHDFLGTGIADASARRVRFIGSAADRIREDYLRILRLFRFHAWYGEGEMEPDALVACAGLAGGLAGLSRERVGREFLRLLSAPRPSATIEAMALTGVLSKTLPSVSGRLCISELEVQEKRLGFSPDPIRRLASLIWGGDPLQAVRTLKLSNDQAKALRLRTPIDYDVVDAETARRLGYERGDAAGRDVLLLMAAASGGNPPVRLLRMITDGAGLTMPLRAADILGLGIEPGPGIGKALEDAEKLWMASDFTLDKATLLDEIARNLHR